MNTHIFQQNGESTICGYPIKPNMHVASTLQEGNHHIDHHKWPPMCFRCWAPIFKHGEAEAKRSPEKDPMSTQLDTYRTAPVPKALYACSNETCAMEYSHPADDLGWWPGSPEWSAGWYCEFCADEIIYAWKGLIHPLVGEDEYPDPPWGPNLAYELARRLAEET